jgi:hypothetical protein
VPGVTQRHLQALREAFALRAASATAVGEATDVDVLEAAEAATPLEN